MSIAIVGTGPAGAAAARELVARGAAVTLFDEQPRSGGNIDRVRTTTQSTAPETLARTSPRVELRTATRVLSTEAGGRV